MKFIALFLTIVIFGLIESSLVPIPLVLLFVIAWSVIHGTALSLTLAFVGGLLVDTMTGRTLGSTGLFTLIISFLLLRYERKINSRSILYIVVVSLVAAGAYQFIFTHSMKLGILIATGIATIPIYLLTILLTQKISPKNMLELELK